VTPYQTNLLAELVVALGERFSKAGHTMAFVTQEHRGTCPPYECGPTCIRIRALIHEACDVLEAETGERPVQIEMFRRAAG
jgi:hypothetical protein